MKKKTVDEISQSRLTWLFYSSFDFITDPIIYLQSGLNFEFPFMKFTITDDSTI